MDADVPAVQLGAVVRHDGLGTHAGQAAAQPQHTIGVLEVQRVHIVERHLFDGPVKDEVLDEATQLTGAQQQAPPMYTAGFRLYVCALHQTLENNNWRRL